MEIVAVIPARFGSTRLLGKPLLSETGRPLIQHVYEAARRASCFQRVIVATDDSRIADAVTAFGGEVAMTRDDHPSGTDRVAEVAAGLPEVDIVVNVQGDEPELAPATLETLVATLREDPRVAMATLATPIRDETTYRDPSAVKVVLDRQGRALYFSRAPIPHHRDGSPVPPGALLHLGLYAYRRPFLLGLASLTPTPLERLEKLEQLRVLEHGEPIAVGIVEERGVGVDTPDDYRRFVARWRARTLDDPSAAE